MHRLEASHAPIRAAIDIGSNTIHIVVARCYLGDLEILEDQEELVRIGESVNARGAISPQKRDDALATLYKYQALAQQYTDEPILVVATEAIRKATNSKEFLADILDQTGLHVHLIDGNVEATLTFYGTTYELNRDSNPPTVIGVMDLGGGSMELVIAKHMDISWRTSIPIGSGWLHDRYLPSNPPTPDELDVASTFLQTYFQGVRIKPRPPALVATGGSANSLWRLARDAFALNGQLPRLSGDDLTRCEAILSTLTADEIAQRYHLASQRARILPAGTLIIRTIMERLRLDEIRISPHGIREGALLARTRYGEQWLHQLQQDTETVPQKIAVSTSTTLPEEETFAKSGRRLLLDRTHKLLEWRDDVLKHEDIEAVHKMRVASRRLRAVLDAYESICDPKRFKKVYRHVKAIADILGKARDTDVMIENLHARLADAPQEEQAGIQWLIDRLSAYRQQHQQQLETFLNKLDADAFKQEVKSCLQRGGPQHGKS